MGNTHGSMDSDATVSVAEVSNMPKEFIKISGNNMPKDIKDYAYTHVIIWYPIDSMQCDISICTMCDSCIPHYKEEAST